MHVCNHKPVRSIYSDQNTYVYSCIWLTSMSAPQADFALNASREAIDSSSPWNWELKEHLPELFCRALASFKTLPAQARLLWINRWMQCIPLQGEVHGATCLFCCIHFCA